MSWFSNWPAESLVLFLNTYQKEPIPILGQLQVEVWYIWPAAHKVVPGCSWRWWSLPSGAELAEAYSLGLSWDWCYIDDIPDTATDYQSLVKTWPISSNVCSDMESNQTRASAVSRSYQSTSYLNWVPNWWQESMQCWRKTIYILKWELLSRFGHEIDGSRVTSLK